MKILLRMAGTAMIALMMAGSSNAQVVFSEDFDNVGGPTAGGAGTYSFPTGWLLRNVDNLTPAASVAYVNQAWERRENFASNTGDSCAFSTSWYSPAGTANDFMWTPAIGPLPSNCVLSWEAIAYDPSFADGYEVRLMTTTPTGGTGDIGNQLSSSTLLFSTPGELSNWVTRTVDLNAFAGQTVYIGFRNMSTDMFILLIDDIIVQRLIDHDPMLVKAFASTDYTMLPQQQALPLPLKALVKNGGAKTLHNVNLQCEVFNSSGVSVYTTMGTAHDSLVSTDTLSFLAGYFTPAVADSFTFRYSVLCSETDQDTTNNYITTNLIITDTLYATEKQPYTGILGIGAGVQGFLGNQFTINDTTELRSVSMAFMRGYTNTSVYAVVFSVAAGLPDSIIASTDTVPFNGIDPQTLTIPLSGGPFTLYPGEYVIAAVETDSTLSLSTSSTYFRASKSWVYWSTSPLGAWAHPESFGSTFAVTFAIRANLYHCPPLTSDIDATDASCSTCADGSALVTADNGISPYTYTWSTGDTTALADNLLPGIYIVTISDAFHCRLSDTTEIGNSTIGIAENIENIGIAPNPSTGLFRISLPGVAGFEATLRVYTQDGRLVLTEAVPAGRSEIIQLDLTPMPSGVYILLYDNGQEISGTKLIKE